MSRHTRPVCKKTRRSSHSGAVAPLAFAAALAVAAGGAFLAGRDLRTRDVRAGEAARLHPTREFQVAGPAAGMVADRAATPRGRGAAAAAGAAGAALRQQQEARALAAAETFENVYNLVREHYVDPLPGDAKMSRGVVRGMISSLNDPNSFFLEPEQRALYETEEEGRYAGIGAVTAIRSSKKDGHTESKIVVVAPMPGSPAEQAGLRPGDVVTHVGGKWVLGSNPMLEVDRVYKRVQNKDASEEDLDKATQTASERIKGGIQLVPAMMRLRKGAGEPLTLTVRRPGVTQPITARLTTAVTEVEPLEFKAVSGPDGREAVYLRVRDFNARLPKALRDALSELPKDGPLVLDLRGNGGSGSLEAAQMVDAALTQGGTFAVEVGKGGKRTPLASPVSQSRRPRPVAVLVDGGTASFAEALAASLVDKGVGTLVGPARTFGDGLMQQLYPLPDGSGFVLTTGKVVGPRGTDWHNAGLSPRAPLATDATEEQAVAAALSALSARDSVAHAARPTAGR